MYQFNKDWPAEIEAISSRPEFQNATVQLIDASGIPNSEYVNGEWTSEAPIPLVETRARVIATRSPADSDIGGNPSGFQAIRVQFPYSAYSDRIKRGTIIWVKDGGRSPDLSEYLFKVETDNFSSNRASRTLSCVVDIESKVTWT